MATDKFVRQSKLRHYASRIARENRSVSTVAFEGVCAGGGGRSRNAKETEGWARGCSRIPKEKPNQLPHDIL